MKLKVCGLNNPENIKEIIKLKPDFIGFIFYPESKRFIFNNLDDDILNQIPSSVEKVGVFVDASIEEITDKYNRYNLDYVQLHGNEDYRFCARLFLKQIRVIKAFQLDSDFDFRILDSFAPFCSYFLFDTKAALPGGNGVKFNWRMLENYNLRIPFFLSGGIDSSDIRLITELNYDMLFAVDINSKFETEAGIKDIEKVKQFNYSLKFLTQLTYENTNR